MDIQKLSYQIGKLIQALDSEESKYISASKLKTLSSTQIHHIDLIYHKHNPTVSELAKLHDKFHSVCTEKLVSNLNNEEIKQLSAILEKALNE